MAIDFRTYNMNVPDWVHAILSSFEKRTDPHSEVQIADALRLASNSHEDMPPEDFKGYHAEWATFLFIEGRRKDSVWGTYFAPMMTATRTDGSEFRSPDVKDLDAEVVAHWEQRARSVKDPVMRARYADLVWDMKKIITTERPSHEYAQIAIDSYVESIDRQLYSMDIEGCQWLKRAFHIALSLKDSQRITAVVEAVFRHYDKTVDPRHPGVWIFPFDLLYDTKGVLTSEQESRLFADLETMLAKTSGEKPEEFDPHGAQAAAERLAQHYRRKGDQDNMVRVIRRSGQAFERISKDASPMLAMAWLQPVIERYEQEGLKEDAERVYLMHAEKGKNIESDLKKYSTTVEISKQEIDEQIERTIGSGELKTSLTNIAQYFVPRTSAARKLLEQMQTETPLLSMIGVNVIEKDGHTSARIGSIEEDPDGRLHRQLAQTMSFYQPFLGLTLDKLREQYAPTVADIAAFLCESPLFSATDRTLLEIGLDAYEKGDSVKAIHVLVPQVEHVLRNFLAILGLPTLKTVRNHPGIMDAKGMNDILNDERIREVLTENLWRYLTVLYIDKRGLNLRNDLAHGLLGPNAFNKSMADRVFHSLLALSLIRAKKNSETSEIASAE
jgi:hypothetical protein